MLAASACEQTDHSTLRFLDCGCGSWSLIALRKRSAASTTSSSKDFENTAQACRSSLSSFAHRRAQRANLVRTRGDFAERWLCAQSFQQTRLRSCKSPSPPSFVHLLPVSEPHSRKLKLSRACTQGLFRCRTWKLETMYICKYLAMVMRAFNNSESLIHLKTSASNRSRCLTNAKLKAVRARGQSICTPDCLQHS